MLRARLLLLTLLLAYWGLSLRHLTIIPPVYEDEPWQASTGWKLASEGVFGSDLFAGLNGMEDHYYGYMPLHPLLLAAVFRGAGVGLFQARFETVVLGLLTLGLTYSLAVRLFGQRRIGLLAVLLLLSVRQTGATPSQTSGILLLDVARIARYDMLVPVFGLAALQVWAGHKAHPARNAALAGFLAGLAGLGHLYGLFWLPLLAILVLWQPALPPARRAVHLALLLLGALLPWLAYGLYVLADFPAWQAQTAGYADRFQLLDAGWYVDNLVREAQRYGPGIDEGRLWLRAGFWGLVLVLPATLLSLWRRALAGDVSARHLAVPATGLPLLFASLLSLKLSNYLVAIVPLWAVAGAWGSLQAWQRLPKGSAGRLFLGALLLAIVFEGGGRWLAIEQAAARTTPYTDYAARLRAQLPPTGSRVLGLHHYWFGLEQYDYRSFAVPLARSGPGAALTLARALDDVAPQVVLVDRHLQAYFDAHPADATQFQDWLSGHGALLGGRIEDETYGPMAIYLIPAPLSAGPSPRD